MKTEAEMGGAPPRARERCCPGIWGGPGTNTPSEAAVPTPDLRRRPPFLWFQAPRPVVICYGSYRSLKQAVTGTEERNL